MNDTFARVSLAIPAFLGLMLVAGCSLMARPTQTAAVATPEVSDRPSPTTGAETTVEPTVVPTTVPQTEETSEPSEGDRCYATLTGYLEYLDPEALQSLIDAAGGPGHMLEIGLFAGALEEAVDAYGGALISEPDEFGYAWMETTIEGVRYEIQLQPAPSASGTPVWYKGDTRHEVRCP